MSTSSRQLPLTLRYPPDQRLDAYIAPPEGAMAQLQAIQAVETLEAGFPLQHFDIGL